jgi:hypothetical protein
MKNGVGRVLPLPPRRRGNPTDTNGTSHAMCRTDYGNHVQLLPILRRQEQSLLRSADVTREAARNAGVVLWLANESGVQMAPMAGRSLRRHRGDGASGLVRDRQGHSHSGTALFHFTVSDRKEGRVGRRRHVTSSAAACSPFGTRRIGVRIHREPHIAHARQGRAALVQVRSSSRYISIEQLCDARKVAGQR